MNMTRPRPYYQLIRSEEKPRQADVMIYGDITSWPWMESDVDSYSLANDIAGLTDVDEINVRINSYGGEVKEGVAIYNALKNSPAKVTTVVDGFACSAASIVFCAGDERIMCDASLLMIHNAWSSAEGDANALRKQADDLEKLTEPSIKAYLSVADLTEEELKQMMDAETWIDSDDALDMGFATKVIKSKAENASQSIRKKVVQMLKNPYQAEDEEPETDEDQPEEPETDDTDGADGEPEEPDTEGENPEDPDDEDEQGEQLCQFLNAIFKQ